MFQSRQPFLMNGHSTLRFVELLSLFNPATKSDEAIDCFTEYPKEYKSRAAFVSMTKRIIPQDFHSTSTSICSSNTDISDSVAQVPSGNIAEAISTLSQHVNRRNTPLLCALKFEANVYFQMTTPQSNSTTFAAQGHSGASPPNTM